MDYNGRNCKTNLETKLKIQALAVFGGMLYWQNTKTNVINIMNATTAGTDRNIPLARQLSGLSGLAVIDSLPHSICKFVYLFTLFVNFVYGFRSEFVICHVCSNLIIASAAVQSCGEMLYITMK